jgi:hypothetical protein
VLTGCVHEPGGRDVDTKVNDLEPSALPHHAHQVLADVVEITLNGADHCGVLGADARLNEYWFEDGGRLLHCPGADEHLGNEELAHLEAPSDDVHGRRHRAPDARGSAPCSRAARVTSTAVARLPVSMARVNSARSAITGLPLLSGSAYVALGLVRTPHAAT